MIPPDELEAIIARDAFEGEFREGHDTWPVLQSVYDRRTLLRYVDELRADLAAERLVTKWNCEMSEACCQCQDLRDELAALKEAAGKVTCRMCRNSGIVFDANGSHPCPDCADLRRLLEGGK